MKIRNAEWDPVVARALEDVRQRIESEFVEVGETCPKMLRLALNEAEALAGETDFPELLFPTLAREKAETASAWLNRQQTIYERTPMAIAA